MTLLGTTLRVRDVLLRNRIVSEVAYVRGDGRGRTRELGAHGDHVIPGLRALADTANAEGALLGVELNHAGRVARAAVSGPVVRNASSGSAPARSTRRRCASGSWPRSAARCRSMRTRVVADRSGVAGRDLIASARGVRPRAARG